MFDFLKKKKITETRESRILPFDEIKSMILLVDASKREFLEVKKRSDAFYKTYGIRGESWYIDLRKLDKDDPLETPFERSILRDDAKWKKGLPASDRLKALLEDEVDVVISLFDTENPVIERIFNESKAGFKIARRLSNPKMADILIKDPAETGFSQPDSFDYITNFLNKIK